MYDKKCAPLPYYSGKRAVFLDRDGVLTVEKLKATHPSKVEIHTYAADCVERLHYLGFLAIVITNQSGVAKGLYTEKELKDFHKKLKMETGVDAIYYCPHHSDGIIPRYSKSCTCRKPLPGMIMRGIEEWGIDCAGSYMVGDRGSDILAGEAAGLATVLLESGYGSKYLEAGIEPDYVYEDLAGFVEDIHRL